ncbi:MAG: nicotinate-nucleotide diphosphorylase, partial [Gammaproteobacteria bacterium]|nr:nicotinate-nucleotide diphosphorylase [Gammaproteobacteria bacterium]
VGTGDLTADLIDDSVKIKAKVVTREQAIVCGIPWFNEVYNQVDESIQINWLVADGDQLSTNQDVCELSGTARHILTGERTALNFLQMLSG